MKNMTNKTAKLVNKIIEKYEAKTMRAFIKHLNLYYGPPKKDGNRFVYTRYKKR